jgi:SAM-dependent methyltransferase
MTHSANYDYVVETVRRLANTDHPRVLDFGCGAGQIVALGLERGLDMYGADTFSGCYESWRPHNQGGASDRIRMIEGGLPFPDGTFDVVVSNQVFEHIADPPRVLPEIRRVLKPGGVFLAIFPLRETWYEGHVGLYFMHRLLPYPTLQRRCLALAHRLGLGLYRDGRTPEQWADEHTHALRTGCFYHRAADVRRWWGEAFGEAPISLAADYVGFRLRGSRISTLIPPSLREPFFQAICHVRAGAVLLVRNRKSMSER